MNFLAIEGIITNSEFDYSAAHCVSEKLTNCSVQIQWHMVLRIHYSFPPVAAHEKEGKYQAEKHKGDNIATLITLFFLTNSYNIKLIDSCGLRLLLHLHLHPLLDLHDYHIIIHLWSELETFEHWINLFSVWLWRLLHSFERGDICLKLQGLLLLLRIDSVWKILINRHLLIDRLCKHLKKIWCLMKLGNWNFRPEAVEMVCDITISTVECKSAIEQRRSKGAIVDLVHLPLIKSNSILRAGISISSSSHTSVSPMRPKTTSSKAASSKTMMMVMVMTSTVRSSSSSSSTSRHYLKKIYYSHPINIHCYEGNKFRKDHYFFDLRLIACWLK